MNIPPPADYTGDYPYTPTPLEENEPQYLHDPWIQPELVKVTLVTEDDITEVKNLIDDSKIPWEMLNEVKAVGLNRKDYLI